MNAAALPLVRAMPETGHFGWDWLSDGRRWRAKTSAGLSKISPGPDGSPNCPRRAIPIDDLAGKHSPGCETKGNRG